MWVAYSYFLWGCSSNLENQSTALVSGWKSDPDAIILQLEQEENPIVRLHKITLLNEHLPGQTQMLCPLLESETDRNRCVQINARPHLWAQETPKTEHESRELEADALDSNCPKDAVFHSCVTQRAKESAHRGQINEANGYCQSITSTKWKAECLFSTAEATILQRGAHGYGQAVELCLVSELFAENCLQHLIMILAKSAPNANAKDAGAWNPIVQAEHAIQTTWGWRDNQRAQQDNERLWSEAIALSFTDARPIGGSPLDFLPVEKHPFVHAAVVRKLMELEAPHQHSLAEWINLTKKILEQRHPQNKTRTEATKRADYADLWEDNSHPNISLMGTSRREYSTVQETDIAICILESAARIPPIAKELFESGAVFPDPAVVRTSHRLQAKIKGL